MDGGKDRFVTEMNVWPRLSPLCVDKDVVCFFLHTSRNVQPGVDRTLYKICWTGRRRAG